MSQSVMTAMALRVPKVLCRFKRDRRGVSAVEFAFVAPLMIGLYLSCAEISSGLDASRKVTLTASTLVELAGQFTTISTSDLTNILNASTATMSPFGLNASNPFGLASTANPFWFASTAIPTATLSCLKIDKNGNTTVAWSGTLNGTAHTAGSAITIPSALAVPSTSLLLGEASYAYTPTVGYTITGTINLSDLMYMRPRITAPSYGSTSCT